MPQLGATTYSWTYGYSYRGAVPVASLFAVEPSRLVSCWNRSRLRLRDQESLMQAAQPAAHTTGGESERENKESHFYPLS